MAAIADFQRVCEETAIEAGRLLLDWRGRFNVREKGPSDLVTEADLASQELIRGRLLDAFPGHGFLAEENLSIASRDQGFRWIVDPLDGTTNYVHGLSNYAVSIALEQSGRLVVGTVYDPAAEECFSAAVGMGAYVNRQPIHASATQQLSEALVATSFSAEVHREDRQIADFIEVLLRCRATRRMGSSALNLCYLAAGRFDAYWATTTQAWDIAAGALLVREAGGVITSLDGGALDLDRPEFVAAGTALLHGQLLALVGNRPMASAGALP
ncbi:MAG: inositol monophosphatase family protein [Pirellulales bacterium]